MNLTMQESLQPIFQGVFVYRRSFVIAAVLILALSTAVGVFWPGRYTSSVTIFVEDKNILGTLMKGAAVQTDIYDEAGLARELVYGRKLLSEVTIDQQLINDSMLPAEVDEVFEGVRDRTSIELVGDNLIEMQYSDSDPDRAYNVTKQFAQLFIDNSITSKINESQAAFDFIDKRVTEYDLRLDELSNAIKKFRAENQTVVPGAEAEIRDRIRELRRQVEDQQQQIREAEVKAASLVSQLSGERETAVMAAETDQVQQRITTLQTQLDILLLSYHERYPDVIALKEQIEDLEILILEGGVALTGQLVTDASADQANQQRPVMDVVAQQLRRDLYSTKTLIATLNARLADTKNSLKVENDRARRIPEIAAVLAELHRDLDVNQTLYNDLLARREYARVSMNVDQENQGLTLRIREPANYPTNTSGPRLIHFVIAGLFLAIGTPLASILARQHLDQKIRSGHKLEGLDRALPVFVEIPHLATPKEALRMKFEYGLLASTLIMAVIGAGAVGIFRMSSII